MIRVYIASPYNPGGNQLWETCDRNAKDALDVAVQLVKLGFAPYPPLWTHFAVRAQSIVYETWMALDFEWLNLCHCVLRLPGESKGADMEEKFAREHGKPVFYSIAELQKYIEEDHTW